MSDFVLYNYFRSSTSYRARVALNLKGITYKYEAVHLINNGGEQNAPEYRRINPIGGVPSLVHKGQVISQSRAIIEYLDAVHPTPAFYPKSAYERAKVNQIVDNINCEIHPMSNLRVTTYLDKNLKLSQAQREEWVMHWNQVGLSACEKILSETAGRFCFGDQVTAADIFLVPHLFAANRMKVDLGPYPTLLRINEECLKLKEFQTAHPHRQPDTPAEFRV